MWIYRRLYLLDASVTRSWWQHLATSWKAIPVPLNRWRECELCRGQSQLLPGKDWMGGDFPHVNHRYENMQKMLMIPRVSDQPKCARMRFPSSNGTLDTEFSSHKLSVLALTLDQWCSNSSWCFWGRPGGQSSSCWFSTINHPSTLWCHQLHGRLENPLSMEVSS